MDDSATATLRLLQQLERHDAGEDIAEATGAAAGVNTGASTDQPAIAAPTPTVVVSAGDMFEALLECGFDLNAAIVRLRCGD